MNAARVHLPVLDEVLAAQQQLTAVERFAQRHERLDAQLLGDPVYRDRLPATPPGPGQQYAFEVDLDACSGCKACVTACHRLNGLDDGEAWRSVGALVAAAAATTAARTVTGACHHCVDPACLRGCPVGAYEKDPATGIVRHLDDQCIGCQYCLLTCPYEVPRYNQARGIVRKCDMCADRLAGGEAPACVQACPTGAITIRVVEAEAARERARQDRFLTGAPSPRLTAPTTIYSSREPLAETLAPADQPAPSPSPAHDPLAVMLVGTQLAVGALVAGAIAAPTPAAAAACATIAALAAFAALAASTLHLGRPLYAFRALLGLRSSWLSREVLAFGLFAGAAALHALVTVVQPPALAPFAPAVAAAAGVTGLAGLACSVMLYAVTGRRGWNLPRTALRFGATAALCGTTTLWLAGGAGDDRLALALLLLLGAKLAGELAILRRLRGDHADELARSARLLAGPLAGWLRARIALALAGAVAAVTGVAVDGTAPLALLLLLAGELVERRLFFTAASAPRMPGVFR